jgi:S1-C subfamily serine protease
LTFPLNFIDQLHFAVTRITTHYYDSSAKIDPKVIGVGTGFFYTNLDSKSTFLITNRHVIRLESENHYPNAIKIRLHVDENDLAQNIEYDIHLYNGIRQIWRTPNPTTADIYQLSYIL